MEAGEEAANTIGAETKEMNRGSTKKTLIKKDLCENNRIQHPRTYKSVENK